MNPAEYEKKLLQLDNEIESVRTVRGDLPLIEQPTTEEVGMSEALIAAYTEHRTDETTEEEWFEPIPLPNVLPPVDVFDLDLLPEQLRAWVADIANRMQCPPDFPAVAALAAISSVIGARCAIQPKTKDDWQVVPNLWAMVVGRPGVKKSPALNEALKPLNRLQAEAQTIWEEARTEWEYDKKLAEMGNSDRERQAKQCFAKNPEKARELLKPKPMPEEPKQRRYIVNDASVEKLGELMKDNPMGLISYRDELYGLLTSLDKQGQEGSRSFYLQAYDGNQGYTFDRIGRGTTYINRVCLAMLGGIQPSRVQEYVRGAVSGGNGDDGLLQRFSMTVWPDVDGSYQHIDQWPDVDAKQKAWDVFDRLSKLIGTDQEPQVWQFDEAAQKAFVGWSVPFEREIRGVDLHPAMISHLAKYRKLVPALALVFALIDQEQPTGIVRCVDFYRATAWADYLRTHANRLYAAAITPETTGAESLLAKIRAGKLVDADGVISTEFTPREVAQKHWTGLGTPEEVKKAARLLADYGWLKFDTRGSTTKGGRPSERYLISPFATGAAA